MWFIRLEFVLFLKFNLRFILKYSLVEPIFNDNRCRIVTYRTLSVAAQTLLSLAKFVGRDVELRLPYARENLR